MASPRVFISSTCYDLADERDSLAEFCASVGYESTLSERGDIFYHPDLHTHTACVRETSNCHLFVLIIGGRFGGQYKIEPSKSITNAEYSSAVHNGTPTFAFVKQEVLNDHNVWQRNKDKAFVKEIHYPSIEKQEHAEEIFNFIDSVRSAPVNNGIFAFRLGKDIHDILRKQWAGMMFDYLQNRSLSKQLSLTNDALGNLAVVSSKIEELVKNIYRNVDAVGAPKAIEVIDNESLAEEFLLGVSQLLRDEKFILPSQFDKLEKDPAKNWWEFVCLTGWAKIEKDTNSENPDALILLNIIGTPVMKLTGDVPKSDKIKSDSMARGYKVFLGLPNDARRRIASKYFWTKEDAENAEKMLREHSAVEKKPVTPSAIRRT